MKKLLGLILFIIFYQPTFGQPNPCGTPPVMANTCMGACIICDIDGYTGINDLQDGGQDIGNIFCSFPNDMHFIAFIAGSTSLSIQISVSNCSAGSLNFFSLDIGFYESLDCQNFTPIVNCQQDIGNGQSYVFNTITPLTIGQYYYIIMDGSAGSICNWTFDVLSGTTAVGALEYSGDIVGNTILCLEDEQTFEVDYPVGATSFEWTLDGQDIGDNSPTISHQFTAPGNYQLCVFSSNICDGAPPTCQQITVEQVPDTEISAIYCQNECFLYQGDTLCNPGFYEYTLDNQNGCDSTIQLELTEWITPQLNLNLNICEGDSIFIGDDSYFTAGQHQSIILLDSGCDSIVNLDLFIIICNISSNSLPIPTLCFGTPTGQFNFSITNGTPPFTYSWEDLNGTISGTGNISSINATETINNLPQGQYVLTMLDGFGNTEVILFEITEPTLLTASLSGSDFGETNISCFGEMDGSINTIVNGGVQPYNYIWSINEVSSSISDLSVGSYIVTVSDINGCEFVDSFNLIQPDSFFITAVFTDPGCSSDTSGSITITGITGGGAPFNYFINGVENEDGNFLSLGPNNYTINIIDDNGCEATLDSVLIASEIPIIGLGNNLELTLGESAILYPIFNNITIQNINWFSTENISCDTCLNPIIMPMFSANYTIEVTSEDGCKRSKSIFVNVIEDRKVFIPNVFTPNGDGENDFFTVFGSMPNVQEIEKMAVFDRWGGLLYENGNFPPNASTAGWDGRSGGTLLNNGVYMYYIKVRFWDNKVIVYKGDISLLR